MSNIGQNYPGGCFVKGDRELIENYVPAAKMLSLRETRRSKQPYP